MNEKLNSLREALTKNIDGLLSLGEIEDNYIAPIFNDDNFEDDIPSDIVDIIYSLDMWEINNLNSDDIKEYIEIISTHLSA